MNIDEILGNGVARVALTGAGQFGAALIGQARRIPGLELAVVCDLDPGRARDLCNAAGFPEVTIVDNAGDLQRIVDTGGTAIVDDHTLAACAPVDIVVEATGHPDSAARTAELAIAAGNHVAMVTKEAESVVGPELNARARAAGVVYTPVDGDQPSLLIGLLAWARRLGLEVVCAGKSSEYDFVFDPERGTVTCLEETVSAPALRELWQLGDGRTEEGVRARSDALAMLSQRTVPDLTEMAVVANATDLKPDTPAFHLPVARTPEVPDVFKPRAAGGLLQSEGVIDVFNCLRRPDEASFAGGVFVVVRCEDRETWQVLRDKGHPVSCDGGYAMMYNPQHLLGLEASTTIMSAALLGKTSGNPDASPRFDVVATATRDFAAGDTLRITNQHHHEVDGLTPSVVSAARLEPNQSVPYYLAADRPLRKALKKGEALTVGHVELDQNSPLVRLRREQDARFHA